MNPSFNQPVQGLRGVSILLVFLSHWYAGLRAAGLDPAGWGAGWVAAFDAGKYGVELFFMISGFVIVNSLRRHQDVRSFLIDRVARIYPLFLVLHLGVFTAGPAVGHKFFAGAGILDWLWLFVTNGLLLPGIVELPIAQIVAWSLSYEVFFYFLAAGAWALLARRVRGVMAAAGWAVLAAAAGWLLWSHPRAWFFIPGVLTALYAGALQERLARVPGVVLPVLLVGFLGAWASLGTADGATLPGLLAEAPANGLVFAGALLAGAVFFAHVALRPSGTARVLAAGPLARLGDISYSFYLCHLFVVVGLRGIFRDHVAPAVGPAAAFWLFGPVALALAVAVSWVSRQLLEVAAGRAARDWLRARWRPAAVPGAAAPAPAPAKSDS